MGNRPGDSVPARVLVAYATKLGSNAEIAEAIASELRATGSRAEAHPVRDIGDLDAWDAVVLGSAIYAAHWRRDARRFVLRLGDALAARPLWLWSSGPLDERLAQAGLPISAHAAEITQGLGALDHRTFGGRLAEDAPIDPQVLQTHPIGDFRDWDVIRDYARQISVALSTMTVPEPGASGASAPG